MYSLRIGFPNWKRWMHEIPTPRSGSRPDEGAFFGAEGVGSPSSCQAKAPTKTPFGTNTLYFSLPNLAGFEFMLFQVGVTWWFCDLLAIDSTVVLVRWSRLSFTERRVSLCFLVVEDEGFNFCQKEGADGKLETLTLIFLSLKGITWTQRKACFLWSKPIFDHPFSRSAGSMISDWVDDFKHWKSPCVCVHVRVYVYG